MSPLLPCPLFLFLLLFRVSALTKCPSQCMCSDNNIVCSCESLASSELSVSSLGGAYIHSLTVHSCAKVTLLNDSFAGVRLVDRISFIEIERLIIEPETFRGIQQSPKQLVIDQTTMPVWMAHTFSGLSHMQHVWIRRSNIGTIASWAFEGISHVEYVYFRETSIHHLERNAFGGMHDVRHLYFRGAVRIHDSEGPLFVNSTFDELVFDDVRGQFDDSFLLETKVQRAEITNCSLQLISRGYDKDDINRSRAVRSGPLLIQNTALNALSPLLLAHFVPVSVERCRVGRVRGSQAAASPNHLQLFLEETYIEAIEPFALSHLTIEKLSLLGCRVANISKGAFAGSQIADMVIEDSHLRTVQAAAFSETSFGRLHILRSRIDHLVLRSFEGASMKEMRVEESILEQMDDGAFHGATIGRLSFNDSVIKVGNGSPFRKTEIQTVDIEKCDFEGIISRAFFQGFDAVRVRLTENVFDCDYDDCQLNSFLLTSPRHQLMWNVEGNACRKQQTKNQTMPCGSPSVTEEYGVRCEMSWAVADCVCTQPSASVPRLNASVIVIGDCEHLILDTNNVSDSPRVLYLYRIAKVEISQVPYRLQAIKIFHSNVIMRSGAWKPGKMALLSLQSSRLQHIENDAISSVEIEEWEMNQSYSGSVSENALQGTSIGTLRVNDSRLESPGVLLRASSSVQMENSILFSSHGLASVRSAQLHNNTVLCCCQNSECSKTTPLKCSHFFPHAHCYRTNTYDAQISSTTTAGSIHSWTITYLFVYYYVTYRIL